MTTTSPGRSYGYRHHGPSYSQAYLQRPIERAIGRRSWPKPCRALDYGCGNGWLAEWLVEHGFDAVGADISESGIAVARRAVPSATFTTDISADSLARLGPFNLVTCIEVIAHCYTPSSELQRLYACLRPGGTLILSTPYHGYIKNLVMAATGRLERHLDTLWSGAHVHYFTIASISKLLKQAGFRDIEVERAGRIAPLAKSMVLTCSKPGQ